VIALSAVVLAGAAGNGAATGGASGQDASAPTAGAGMTSADTDIAAGQDGAAGEDGATRVVEASRGQAREPLPAATQARAALAERRDHAVAPDPSRSGSHTARAESLAPQDPREIAQSMLAEHGWDASEFSCLDQLWVSESDWDHRAENPSSGAYGIPQSLPPEKMASAGSDWRTNPATQIEWGLDYIDDSYGTPCSAWEFKQANNWY
jgi:hypothetical protein